MGILIISILVVSLLLNLINGAAAAFSVRQMGQQAWEEGCKNREAMLRENAKKANIYYNPVGHYYEHDRNYDGSPKK